VIKTIRSKTEKHHKFSQLHFCNMHPHHRRLFTFNRHSQAVGAAGDPAMLSDWKIETADNAYTAATSAGTITLTTDDMVLQHRCVCPGYHP
jgi:hypothetical protein